MSAVDVFLEKEKEKTTKTSAFLEYLSQMLNALVFVQTGGRSSIWFSHGCSDAGNALWGSEEETHDFCAPYPCARHPSFVSYSCL